MLLTLLGSREGRVEGSGGIERGESRGERRWSYSTHGATVPAGTVHELREAEDQRLGLQGALGTPAAGLRPRPAREKVFPSNLLLDYRLIHLLSLYRDV
jgi:hypothetical protein